MRERYPLNGWNKPHGYFEGLFERAERQELEVAIALDGDEYVGHVKIVWKPAYESFRELGIPALEDLSVLPMYRRMGVGTRLLDWAEGRAAAQSHKVGMGVGLYADYGPAQKMYVERGYVPDGAGVFSGGEPIEPGGSARIDDSLVLWLVKEVG